jgi:hypothetical protein
VIMMLALRLTVTLVTGATKPTPACASACAGQSSCTSPPTGCSHTGVNEAFTSVPINETGTKQAATNAECVVWYLGLVIRRPIELALQN